MKISPIVILILFLNNRISNLFGTAKTPFKDYTFSSFLIERCSHTTKFWPMRREQKHCGAVAFSLEGGDGPFPFSFFFCLNKVINAGAFAVILSHEVTLRPKIMEGGGTQEKKTGSLSSGTILIPDFLSLDYLKKIFFKSSLLSYNLLKMHPF